MPDTNTAPQPIPVSQPPGLPQAVTDEEGAESLAAQPDMGATIAQHQIAAGQVNNGNSRDWAENMVAGVQSALAGFGAAGRVNPGSGALAGVGAAARQAQARNDELAKERIAQGQRQQALNMEQKRVSLEERHLSDTEKQNLIENARQQAEQTKRFAMDDANLKLAQSRDQREAQEASERHMEFVQRQEDYLWHLQQVKGGPAKVNGVESPEFEHYGDMEAWAKANNLHLNTHENGYIERPVVLENGKSQIWQVPDAQADWTKVKDAYGNPMSAYADPLAVMNAQDKIAETRERNARASKDFAQAKKDNQKMKDDETAAGARHALDAATRPDGTIDRSKMKAGQIEQIRKDMLGQWREASASVRTTTEEMKHDLEYLDTEDHPEKLKALKDKYGVTDAEKFRDEASAIVAQLDGAAYKAPGGEEKKAAAGGDPTGDPRYQAALNLVRTNNLTPAQIDASPSLPQEWKERLKADLAKPADTRNFIQKATDAATDILTHGHRKGPTAPNQ